MKKQIIPDKPQFEIKGYLSAELDDLEIAVREGRIIQFCQVLSQSFVVFPLLANFAPRL